MTGQTCPVCGKRFRIGEQIIRVVIEVASQIESGEELGPVVDGKDEDYWSNIHDWSVLSKVHLPCAVRALNQGEVFPYDEECWELPVEQLAEELMRPPPKLRLVQSG